MAGAGLKAVGRTDQSGQKPSDKTTGQTNWGSLIKVCRPGEHPARRNFETLLDAFTEAVIGPGTMEVETIGEAVRRKSNFTGRLHEVLLSALPRRLV